MVGIIVTGHGNFATGLTSSVKLIAGMPELYETVDFVQEDSVEDLETNLNAAIDNLKEDCKEGILIFTDLVGGSPFKTSVEISLTREEKIVVLGGTNLGMLVEISMARTFMDDLDALAQMAVNTGQTQVMRYEFKERVVEDIDDFEDGI
ncbi:MAG: PTS sugar transporter subunit IIA [Bacillota bacterium]|jgi:PTS system N-acetylgalactosamine-specific IIA component|nr:PTS sugar transporter subunit IIA [Bacillota bacterium]NLL25961.1 PTS sugar transporter subunit IIA [Erysipelotrichia bacterium]